MITIKIKKYFKKSINISFKTSVPATNNETCVQKYELLNKKDKLWKKESTFDYMQVSRNLNI